MVIPDEAYCQPLFFHFKHVVFSSKFQATSQEASNPLVFPFQSQVDPQHPNFRDMAQVVSSCFFFGKRSAPVWIKGTIKA
jgi:hypothetical protein